MSRLLWDDDYNGHCYCPFQDIPVSGRSIPSDLYFFPYQIRKMYFKYTVRFNKVFRACITRIIRAVIALLTISTFLLKSLFSALQKINWEKLNDNNIFHNTEYTFVNVFVFRIIANSIIKKTAPKNY